jgi:hypothetical protein
MNVYPLRAARPQNLAEVEDRKHELCFGNHLRQDRETAERINKLAQTVQDLAELAQDRLTPELQAQVHRVGLYKVVKTIEIDLQHTQGADERSAPDNAAGLRDFSKATVMLRRERGRKYADGKLRGVFSPQSGR